MGCLIPQRGHRGRGRAIALYLVVQIEIGHAHHFTFQVLFCGQGNLEKASSNLQILRLSNLESQVGNVGAISQSQFLQPVISNNIEHGGCRFFF